MGTKKSTTKKGRSQDRKLVAGKQGYEVATVARKTKQPAKKVRAAIKKVGHSRKKVEDNLRK